METKTQASNDHNFFDRDLSWLTFNERILLEAGRRSVPLLERINFLSIFSSNLDEFYRVRMPALAALNELHSKEKGERKMSFKHRDVLQAAKDEINYQQELFGKLLREVTSALEPYGITFLYDRPLPLEVVSEARHYFFAHVLGFLKPVYLRKDSSFFPVNSRLYFAFKATGKLAGRVGILNIPTDHLPRFFTVSHHGTQYVIFLDDIIRTNLDVFETIDPASVFTFKVTRDAEIDLGDEYQDDMAGLIEKQIAKRDHALATRFLYESGASPDLLHSLLEGLGLSKNVTVAGGRYHNLKDLNPDVFKIPHLRYPKSHPLSLRVNDNRSLLDEIKERDILLHTPYHSYDAVLRFFNEASINPQVEHIYLTIYRVANDSQILNALLSSAHNGKKVTILIELKARFDEENNIKWAKRLKKAGVQVLYSRNEVKVHAKVALIVLRDSDMKYRGLLSTGNLNESTARFYTDHILLTSNTQLLQELRTVFTVFEKGVTIKTGLRFKTLLVARYNLQDRFVEFIDREIANAKTGLPARIIIKLNNLEEPVLIKKLYDASNAGVKIDLIIRSICCLIPGIPGMSENIRIKRIVDRYLEHGRLYFFHNNGNDEVYLGSADWMNRNIYKRIEVCFPVIDRRLKKEITDILQIQIADNVQGVLLDEQMRNRFIETGSKAVQSQVEIVAYLNKQSGAEYENQFFRREGN